MLHWATPRWQGDLDKAKAHLLKALQMDPDAVQCQKDLREVKTLQGHHTRGNDAFTVSLLSNANTSGSLALDFTRLLAPTVVLSLRRALL